MRALPENSATSQPLWFKLLAAAGLVVRAGGGANHLSIDHQIHARFSLPAAAADEELEVMPLDSKLRRSERAGAAVSALERIDQALAVKAFHRHLPGKLAVRRSVPNAVPGRLPLAISVAFKIRDDDVRLAQRAGVWRRKREADAATRRRDFIFGGGLWTGRSHSVKGWRSASGRLGVAPDCEQTNAATALACRLICSSGQSFQKAQRQRRGESIARADGIEHAARQPGMLRPLAIREKQAALPAACERYEPKRKAIRERGKLRRGRSLNPNISASTGSSCSFSFSAFACISDSIDHRFVHKRRSKIHVKHAERLAAGGIEQDGDDVPDSIRSLRKTSEANRIRAAHRFERCVVGLNRVPGDALIDRVSGLPVRGEFHGHRARRMHRVRLNAISGQAHLPPALNDLAAQRIGADAGDEPRLGAERLGVADEICRRSAQAACPMAAGPKESRRCRRFLLSLDLSSGVEAADCELKAGVVHLRRIGGLGALG